jgi:hypothetical protein
MKSVIAYKNQSLFDLSIKNYGTVDAVVLLAFHNNMSITEELTPGQVIEIPELEVMRRRIVDYYKRKEINPATAITEQQNRDILPDDGCNYCKLFE